MISLRYTYSNSVALFQLLRIEGVAWSAQRIPTAVNLGFLDRSRYFYIQVAPLFYLTKLLPLARVGHSLLTNFKHIHGFKLYNQITI
jgi:hypothetical protein